MAGHLIAFEGLDQSGKQTQAELLRDRLKEDGRKARLVSFPDYGTSIGEEIARALQGEREYGPDVVQLLYVANRYERKPDLPRWLYGGLVLVYDRYMAPSVRIRYRSWAPPVGPPFRGAVSHLAPTPRTSARRREPSSRSRRPASTTPDSPARPRRRAARQPCDSPRAGRASRPCSIRGTP